MTLNVEKFERKPLYCDAVQVTADNMEELAIWCHGTIETEQVAPDRIRSYIYVDVTNAMNERQKQAHIGDWVLFANHGFKVYLNKAFRKGFAKVDKGTQELVRPNPIPGASGSSGATRSKPIPRDPATPTPMNMVPRPHKRDENNNLVPEEG